MQSKKQVRRTIALNPTSLYHKAIHYGAASVPPLDFGQVCCKALLEMFALDEERDRIASEMRRDFPKLQQSKSSK